MNGKLAVPLRVGDPVRKEVHAAPVVTLMEPEVLNRILQAFAGEIPGRFFFPNFQIAIAVPAGGEVTFTYWLPTDFVCTRQTPWTVVSDYYHPDLQIMVYVDDEPVTPYPAALTRPTDFNFGEHYVKRRSIKMTATNNTVQDVTVTFFTLCCMMHVSVYEYWYRLLVRRIVHCLDDCVLAEGGKPLL